MLRGGDDMAADAAGFFFFGVIIGDATFLRLIGDDLLGLFNDVIKGDTRRGDLVGEGAFTETQSTNQPIKI